MGICSRNHQFIRKISSKRAYFTPLFFLHFFQRLTVYQNICYTQRNISMPFLHYFRIESDNAPATPKIKGPMTIKRSILIEEVICQSICYSENTYSAFLFSGYRQFSQPLIRTQPKISVIILLHTANHITRQIIFQMHRLKAIILCIIQAKAASFRPYPNSATLIRQKTKRGIDGQQTILYTVVFAMQIFRLFHISGNMDYTIIIRCQPQGAVIVLHYARYLFRK